MAMQANINASGTLADLIDRILDKGMVINADIKVSVAGVELLDIKIRAAISSFETAALYGLEFPSGVNTEAPGWQKLAERDSCPTCEKKSPRQELITAGCPWCGWVSARAGTNDLAPLDGIQAS